VVDTGGGLLRDTLDVVKVLGVLVVNQVGQITSIVEDHVEGLSIGESAESLLDTPVVLLLGLSLPSKDGDTGGSDGSGSVVLGGEDVARRPRNLGTEVGKGLDEDSGLDGPARQFSAAIQATKISTHMWRHPAIRAPFKGWLGPYFSRMAMRPGISCSASSISFRPKAAREMSATL
jgi:hypothetical protein